MMGNRERQALDRYITGNYGEDQRCEEEMKRYSVGFLFNRNGTSLALIHKRRPEWQRMKWNGIGGHVEVGETFEQAMVREFREEAGVMVVNWENFAAIVGESYHIRFFRSFTDDLSLAVTMTDEPVLIQPVSTWLQVSSLVPNLRWLIPLALDKYIAPPVVLAGRDCL